MWDENFDLPWNKHDNRVIKKEDGAYKVVRVFNNHEYYLGEIVKSITGVWTVYHSETSRESFLTLKAAKVYATTGKIS